LIVLALIIGFVMWYFYFGLECFINGGGIGVNPWIMPFHHAWGDFKNNIPFGWGWHHRMKFTRGNVDWARMMPGPIHFGLTHVLLPAIPLIVVIVSRLR
jgi:hypothetical protein